MPVPPVLGNRLTAAIAAVNATTDLDLLISYLDVGQRSGVDITTVTAEIARRSNLVDANTPYTTAAKLAVAMFKIDNPTPALWGGGASGAGGGGAVLGQYVSGWLGNNPNFVPANGSLYLVSAYPDMLPLLNDRVMESFYAPAGFEEKIARASTDTAADRVLRHFVDGNTIIVPQSPAVSSDYYLLNVSNDNGVTWRGSILRSSLSAIPEVVSNSLHTGSQHVIDVVKLDSPGHYAALVAQNNSSGRVGLIRSTDGGLNWFGWSTVVTAADLTQPMNVRLFYRNGVYLFLAAGTSQYSTNDGASWSSVAGSNWRSNNLRTMGVVANDGYLMFSDSSTSLLYFLWPATSAGWVSTLDFTTRANAFATSVNAVKKCGSVWVAWHTTTGNSVYVTTDPISGTWTRTILANVTTVYDITEVGGHLFVIGMGSNGIQIFTTPANTTIPTTLTALSATDFPHSVNATSSLRWPMGNNRFAIMLGSNVGAFFKHGRSGVAKYVDVTGPSRFQHVFYDQPTHYAVGFCYKYNRWFTSIPPISTPISSSVNYYASPAQAVPGQQMLHYASVDGKSWTPVGVGYGHIVDAGSRLVRISGNGQIQVSTDGIAWTVSGVTQPTGLPTIAWMRLWRVKDLLFLCVSNSVTDNTNAGVWVSSNGGLNWTATNGLGNVLNMAYTQACIVNYRGIYYAMSVYSSAAPATVVSSVDQVSIYRSADGVTWTYSYGQPMTSVSTARYDQMGMFNYDGVLYALAGGRPNSSTTYAQMVTSNGATWAAVSSSTIFSILSSSTILGMDTQNGEQRWYFNQQYTIQQTSLHKLTTFKDGVSDVSMYGPASMIPNGLSGSGADLMGSIVNGTVSYNSGSLAFLAAATTTMTLPHLKVTK